MKLNAVTEKDGFPFLSIFDKLANLKGRLSLALSIWIAGFIRFLLNLVIDTKLLFRFLGDIMIIDICRLDAVMPLKHFKEA